MVLLSPPWGIYRLIAPKKEEKYFSSLINYFDETLLDTVAFWIYFNGLSSPK